MKALGFQKNSITEVLIKIYKVTRCVIVDFKLAIHFIIRGLNEPVAKKKLHIYLYKLFYYNSYSIGFEKSNQINIFFNHLEIERKLNLKLNGCNNKFILWETLNKFGSTLCISLEATEDLYCYEGMLNINLYLDGDRVFELSFVFLNVNNCQNELLITRIQGNRLKFEEIKLISKSFKDLRVSVMLIYALEGLALRLGLRKINCVSSRVQNSNKNNSNSFKSTYDELMISLDAKLDENFIFNLPLPIRLGENSKSCTHRARHKHHMNTKNSISQSAYNVDLKAI